MFPSKLSKNTCITFLSNFSGFGRNWLQAPWILIIKNKDSFCDYYYYFFSNNLYMHILYFKIREVLGPIGFYKTDFLSSSFLALSPVEWESNY